MRKKHSIHLPRVTLLLILLAGIHILSMAQPRWRQEVNYSIEVSLDDQERTLDGFCSMQYSNHSPDTLRFIWIHLWPNAFRNDQTAFSEQLLGNGRTDFYFSDKDRHGYINRLDFRVDGALARTEDHPLYIDILKLLLPVPLPPGGTITINTPFHVKLPYNFSRGGYKDQGFQITQWYPKPAVYDSKGWHEMPYLDQGEFYGEYGSYDVRITAPSAYLVAATGELQDAPALQETSRQLASQPVSPAGTINQASPAKKGNKGAKTPRTTAQGKLPANPSRSPRNKPQSPVQPPQAHKGPTKTLHYHQDNIHDFAWFASRQYLVSHDTLQLRPGHNIQVFTYYTPAAAPAWRNSVRFIKEVVRYRSRLIGDYPFNVLTVVEAGMGDPGGMEYPTIAAVTPQKTEQALYPLLDHEVGHNWFSAVLGSNERRYPWMDEGMNTYYDNRFEDWRRISRSGQPAMANRNWIARKFPSDPSILFINTLAKENRDQPISSPSAAFTAANYDLFAYSGAAIWLKQLEDTLGTPLFDSCMQSYYAGWQFNHPYPEDFQQVVERVSGRNLTGQFAKLDTTGPVAPFRHDRKLRPTFLFSGYRTDKYNYIGFMPAIGFNDYDHFMVGALIHNYNLPPNRLQFVLAPLYGTVSHRLNGLGDISYSWYPDRPGAVGKVRLGIGAARFSTLSGTDSNGNALFGGFYKFTPSLRIDFRNRSPRSTVDDWIEWKTYLIGEKGFNNYVLKSSDSLRYPTNEKYIFRYLNQLSVNIEDHRALYPYRALVQFQQGPQFYRINFTGNYFLNYPGGGGVNVRLFAAKFGALGSNYSSYDLMRFEPKLTAVGGSEDYTYDNYFFGRNEYSGAASQQIMMRDGDLKIRVPSFPFLEGRSDNWVSSLNLNTSLPYSVIPAWIPLKIFFDIGTYSEAWKDNPPTSRFLYVAGLQLSFFHNVLNVYAPLVYSSDFSDQLKTLPDQNSFRKKLSFSIDIQNLRFKALLPPNIPL